MPEDAVEALQKAIDVHRQRRSTSLPLSDAEEAQNHDAVVQNGQFVADNDNHFIAKFMSVAKQWLSPVLLWFSPVTR